MREIGSIAGEREARAVADYLLTLNITTKLESRAGGWVIWVHREDRLLEARSIFADFETNPGDLRFQAASKQAKEIRKKSEKVEKAHRKQVKSLRDRWEGSMYLRAPLAFALILISVAVTGLTHLDPRVYQSLRFSIEAYDDQTGWVDTGLLAIQQGQVWRLITPIFLHFGLVHLFFNMMAMRYLGERIEMSKGTWRFALICLVAAIGGDVGEFAKSGGGFGGMSGVVFALAGYLWIKGHTDPADGLSLDNRSVNWMLGWFLLGIMAPIVAGPDHPHVFPYNMANVAHGVGLGVGMVFGLLRF